MSRRWLSTRCVSGFARREAAREGERAGAPVVGHRALRLQRAGGWRGEGGQGRGWRHRLEVGPEVASAWSARAARPPRPRTATCGRSPGSRSSSRRGESGASSITGGLGVQQQRSKRGKKSGCYFECQLSRRTVLGPLEKLAGGRAQRVGATPTGRAPRLGPSARGPRRRGAPRAHGRPARAEDAGRDLAVFARKSQGAKGGVRIRYIIRWPALAARQPRPPPGPRPRSLS